MINDIQTNIINESTIPPYCFSPGINTLCIKATLGMGKTNNLYDFLNNNLQKQYKSCLIVSFRRLLCKKYYDELPNFEYYENIKESEIDSSIYPFLICQIDSIKKIRGHYDLVIFDEITYTMNHLISSVDSKKRCHDYFIQLMYDDNHIIVMDALLNENWIKYIQSFKRSIKYIINIYTIHNKKKIYNYGTNRTAFLDEFKNSIDNGQNVVVASNNKKMIEFIDNILVNEYKDVKKLIIKKENNLNYDLNQWNKVQVLCYTPSIVAGISYTEKHFDKMFGIFCNSSATADMALQQLFRVRNIDTNEFHICCDITGKNDYPENEDDIKKLIIKEDRCLIKGLDNITIDYIKKDIVQDEFFRLFNIIQKNKFRSCNNYIKELINLLQEQGISQIVEIKTYDENNKKNYNKQRKIFNKIIKEQDAIRIECAPDVTEDEIQEIKSNNMRTDNDNYILKKDSLKKRLKIKKITKDIILKYGKAGKKLWNLSYVYGYNNYHEQLIKRINYDEKRIDNEDNTYRLGRDRKYETMLLCDHMVKYFGFNGPLDINHIEIDRNKFKEYILKYSDIIESYFKCNKFDMKVFDEHDWYKKSKIYINSKLKSIYGISIVEDKKNKKQYLKGLDFWDDNSVTYKNIDIINDIIENENKLYENEIILDLVNNILKGAENDLFN